jgi:hypothetical protein
MASRKQKHGHCVREDGKRHETPTYCSWRAMKGRCNHVSNNRYYAYGARGIKVCARWMQSFENFLKDMGERPSGMTLDRKDNDGDYTPKNCRWADAKTQASTQRKRQRATPSL